MRVIHDKKRGCGWRKKGGLYLVAETLLNTCGKLPLPLAVCPCCGAGIKPARGWTWVDGDKLFAHVPCPYDEKGNDGCKCPLAWPVGKCCLIWVGESFYPTPSDFFREVERQGVSRRVYRLPDKFIPGHTPVLLAHRRAVRETDPATGEITYKPGIFSAYRPSEIQYVCNGGETPEQLARMEARGITPVRIVRENADLLQCNLFSDVANAQESAYNTQKKSQKGENSVQ
ncbi:MAG TPA: hypothetical protein PKH75_13505 [Bacillota bacterium]|nr:hypothetical protein [Bacillota bacterium]